jgi:hypothetical protein
MRIVPVIRSGVGSFGAVGRCVGRSMARLRRDGVFLQRMSAVKAMTSLAHQR